MKRLILFLVLGVSAWGQNVIPEQLKAAPNQALPFGIRGTTNLETDLVNWWTPVEKAWRLTKAVCWTVGADSTATLNFQRNGTNIFTANLVATTAGASTCASGCTVNTISAAQDDFAAGTDFMSYDYVSSANTPTGVGCNFLFREVLP